ncbi:MAG: PQQ-binding-like beta-propeller repeat protein [Verrucomicrobia bacterium]|nr:PQQ-binding-like beta-propeller repeat protein [Verrucomicrobiota bacterium]
MRATFQVRRRRLLPSCQVFLLTGALAAVQQARADWPTYRHDAARSGYTAEPLPAKLSLSWSFRAPHPPQPAWPRSARLTFDRAFQPVVAGGVVCFGSSVDGQIHALDATNGSVRWTFPTEAPVRFAPAFWSGRFYAASDDGHLYCLDARTGALHWKKRGAPNDEMVLGNDRMISRWPARGGPVVVDGVVCFAAGIWPSDGISLFALDAVGGEVRWVNDSADQMFMGQPHPGAYSHSGIAPQGYLVAGADRLFVPNGRAVPAAFRQSDGRFEYFHLQSNGQRGGGATVVADRFFINDGLAFDQATGATALRLERGVTAALPDGLLQVTATNLIQYRWADRARVNRKGKNETARDLQEVLRFAHRGSTTAVEVIVARDEAVLGTDGQVRRLSLPASNEVWTANVDGAAYGLAVAEGRLFASTDQGMLYCFSGEAEPVQERRPRLSLAPYGNNELARRAAVEIIQRTGVTNGYCLDLGCGDGALAYELAQRTGLRIVAVDADPANVANARARLSEAGLSGSRVTVLQRDLAKTSLPVYFANLIISGRSVAAGESAVPRAEAARLQRPYGGVLCLGRPGALVVQTRGPLEGAGQWTHQYADAANTLCSADELVQGPLGMLWFSDVDQRLVQRHGRAPAPLFKDGILYSEGRDSLAAVDAYNGLKLWEYSLPGILEAYEGDHLMGASGSGSNFSLSDDSVFVRREDHCLRLDAKTGKLLGTFSAPAGKDGGPGLWGFLACEKGILYGSLANPEHVVTFRYLKGGNLAGQLTESRTLFALDAATGKLKWRYDARHSIRHNTFSAGDGRVILIDRPLTLYDRVRGEKPAGEQPGELVALDADSGRELWRNSNNIYGTVTILSAAHQKVLMSYQPTRFALASELGGRMTCFDLSSGERVWERELKYQSRPVLNDRTIYAEGGAWDLDTGAERAFPFKRSYGCGILAGARNLMVFRSATLGYFDLDLNQATEEFGGMRPGCWLNVLPVGGLVLAPDGTTSCQCSYPNQAWMALRPDGVRPPVMEPAGDTSRKPVTVNLRANHPAAEEVRYTLDGTAPTGASLRYSEPLTLTHSAVLQARSFGANHRASRVVTARFTIDPAVVPLNADTWRTCDAPGAKPPSAWTVMNGEIIQTANTLVDRGEAMSKSPGAERPGTLRVYERGREARDGELSFEIQSEDNDTVGLAFRLADAEHYYLWSMDSERGFRALTVKDGASYTLLAANESGYVPGKWYQVRVVLDGPRLTVYVDGQKDLEAEHARFAAGTLAPYAWGNAGVRFRNVMFKAK